MPIILDPTAQALLGPKRSIVLDDTAKALLQDASPDKKDISPPTAPEAVAATEPSPAPALPRTAPDPMASLTPIQKILVNPGVSKAIDFLSGGMSPAQAEQNAQTQIGKVKRVPGDLMQIGKTIADNSNPFAPLTKDKMSNIVDSAGKGLGIMSMPFMPAYQGVMGAGQAMFDGKNIPDTAKAGIKGFLAPESVPLWTSPERMPLTKDEREGGTAALVPRAVANGIEQVVLGHMVFGATNGLIGKEATEAGVKTDVNHIFDMVREKKDEVIKTMDAQGRFPKGWTDEQKSQSFDDHVAKSQALFENDPNVVASLSKNQTFTKLLGDKADAWFNWARQVGKGSGLGNRGSVPLGPEEGKIDITTSPEKTKEIKNALVPQPWEMTKEDFAAAVAKGKINKATGKILPEEKGVKTPLQLGLVNKYPPEDIAHFYATRRGYPDLKPTPEYDPIAAGRKELIQDALSEGKPVPAEVLKEYPDLVKTKPIEVVTDAAKAQEIKNSIDEGELILKSGRTVSGRKMSPEELGSVQRAVDNSKAKLGITPLVKPSTDAEKNKLLELYRGSNKSGNWYTPDESAAKEYAGLLANGKVIKKSFKFNKVAEKEDILRVADKVGAKKDQALYWLVSPENSNDAPAIISQLRKEGFDAAHLPKGEDFTTSGKPIESYFLLKSPPAKPPIKPPVAAAMPSPEDSSAKKSAKEILEQYKKSHGYHSVVGLQGWLDANGRVNPDLVGRDDVLELAKKEFGTEKGAESHEDKQDVVKGHEKSLPEKAKPDLAAEAAAGAQDKDAHKHIEESNWEEEEQQQPKLKFEHPIEEKAAMEISMLDYTGGLHPLEAAMRDLGKLRIEPGQEEEFIDVPKRFIDVKKGQPIDEIRRALEMQHGLAFDSDSDVRQALKDLGDKPFRFKLSSDVQEYLGNKGNRREVELLGRKLARSIPPTKYKKIINSNVGLKPSATPFFSTKEKMLKYLLAAEARGSKRGFAAGRSEAKAEAKPKIKEARSRAIAELKNFFANKTEEMQREAQLQQLKDDIIARDKSGAKLSAYKNKAEEKLDITRREAELQRLKDDIIARDKLRVKREIIAYAKEKLPQEVRGKYLTAIGNAETAASLSATFRRIDQEAKNVERKAIVEELKELSKKALESGQVAVDYKNQIETILNEIELKKRRPETLDRLRETKKFMYLQRLEGKDVEMPERILKQIETLMRRQVDQMEIAELKNIRDEVEILTKLGETKLRSRKAIYDMRKERITKELLAGTMPLEKNELMTAEPGEKLPALKKFQNIFYRINQGLQHLDLVITPMDTFFDLMDGGHAKFDGPNYRFIKKTTDTNYQSYLRLANKHAVEAIALAKELKLNDQNFERIGIHAARMQADGRQKLVDTGLTEQQIDKIELTPEEMKFYRMMRKTFDELRPAVAETMKNVYNQPLGEVENYVSFITDFDKMSETEIYRRVGEGAPEIRRPTKNPNMGFTKERTGGSQAIKLNAMDIFLRHVDNVAYLVNMAEDNRMVFEIVNSPEYGQAAGDLGQRLALEWIDLVSRKGGLAGEHRIAVLDILRRNFGLAQLGLNVTSALIQPTALLDGAAVLGNYAFDGTYRVLTDPQARQFVFKTMPELKARIGDDPAYSDFGSNKFMAAAGHVGYAPIKFFDGITAVGVAHGAYLKKLHDLGLELDYEKPNKEALSYAQLITRQTQSSGLFKDAPPAISRGKLTGNRSFDKAFFQFQSFMLTRWGIIRNYLWRANIRGGRNADPSSRDYRAAALAFSMLALALVAETQARRGITAATNKALGKATPPRTSFGEDFLQNLVQTIPFVSQFVSLAVYKGDIIPSWAGVRDVATGVNAAVNAASSKIKGEPVKDKTKATIDFMAGMGDLFGIPGTAQARKMGKAEVDSNQKKNIVSMYESVLRGGDKKQVAEADQLANDNGILIKEAREEARRRVRHEMADLYQKALLTGKKDYATKANEIGKTAGFGQKTIEGVKQTARDRLKKAKKETQLLDKQQAEFKSKPRPSIFDEAQKMLQGFQSKE